MHEIRDMTLIVTGAGGNLGAATARLLAARGARLVLLDRDAEQVRRVLGDVAASERCAAASVDVTDEAAVRRALDAAARHVGPAGGLICTVGGYKGGAPTLDSPWSDWEAMIALNVRATVACSRAALPVMVDRGKGSIVHVASTSAIGPAPGQAAYGAAKAAALSFTESLAAELKDSGVRVNAVLPGTMDTPQNRSWMSEADVAKAVAPAAVAEVIAFLLSDAAGAVTGAAIRVTGRQ